jgi:hypothetical protein
MWGVIVASSRYQDFGPIWESETIKLHRFDLFLLLLISLPFFNQPFLHRGFPRPKFWFVGLDMQTA